MTEKLVRAKTNEPVHDKTYNKTCATSEGPISLRIRTYNKTCATSDPYHHPTTHLNVI